MSGDLSLPPYARLFGITLDRWEGGSPILAVDYGDLVCGNPGTFHGGALGGLLGLAALAALRANSDGAAVLTPLNATVEYLRGAGERRTYAIGEVVRAGRRLANLRAAAWQDDPDKPVATATFNIAIGPA
jgi:uncharacterized protein (TIGR00369 family)